MARASVVAALVSACLPATAQIPAVCAPGTWTAPGGTSAGESAASPAAFADHAIVLLGENHDDVEQHRWQLHAAAALHAHQPNMVFAFEMFPRGSQSVLDAWVAGELSIERFLDRVDWDAVWGYPAQYYTPLFHFARQNRIPMVALNVDRELIARVGRAGWDAVPEAEREGVSEPAPPSEAYRRRLARIYAFKARHGQSPPRPGEAVAPPSDAEIAAALESAGFERFVDAQMLWDRAMAEAAAAAHRRPGRPLVVGFVGRGHAEYGWGIPRQLADLGIEDVAVLLPVDGAEACRQADPDVADALFVLDPVAEEQAPRPRLGVMIEPAADGGARVLRVVEDSVAAVAGLKAGDVIRRAAGVDVADHRDLIALVRRQAPGTWLPLQVDREGDMRQVVARFPARSRPDD